MPSTSTLSATSLINARSNVSVIVGVSNAFSAPFVIVIVYVRFPLTQFCLSAEAILLNFTSTILPSPPYYYIFYVNNSGFLIVLSVFVMINFFHKITCKIFK